MPIKLNKNDSQVVVALRDIYKHLNLSGTSTDSWVSTRDIAERCDLNIYRARYSLLKLVNLGMAVQQSEQKRNRNWRPGNTPPQ